MFITRINIKSMNVKSNGINEMPGKKSNNLIMLMCIISCIYMSAVNKCIF